MVESRRFPAAALLGGVLALALASRSLAAAGPGPATAQAAASAVATLTASQVVERHVAARGGAPAWQAVRTLTLAGRIDAGRGDNLARARRLVDASRKASGKGTNAEILAANDAPEPAKVIQLPFTLEMKRPNKSRMEVVFDGKTAVQVFDGQHGWKLRPFLNRNDAEPYTTDETRNELARGDLNAPLVDLAARGARFELEGVEPVDGRPAYKLKATPKGGDARHVWVDAKSFLDVKVEGMPRHMDGRMHPVYVTQRDFRAVDGVMIPFVFETAVDGYAETHSLQIEKASVNPALDDARFLKPHA